MKALFIVLTLVTLSISTFTTSTQCTCSQLVSQSDCVKQQSENCVWDTAKQSCSKNTSIPVTPAITYPTYCEQFSITNCPTQTGCQWLLTKCSHFTGCTAFQKTTDGECQQISNKCITDGSHCVEKGTCISYLKQIPCLVSDTGSQCYWDSSATPNVCIDATLCEHLPLTYLTDIQCRAQISTCTTKSGGGCQTSGNNCSDQTSQSQCFWNKLKTQSCFWNGTTCVDKICVNGLVTYTTDDSCKNYLNSCTTKSGGGCVTRAACSVATNQESCKTNSSGNLCYWNSSNVCVDKNCSAAPSTYTTNKQCNDFVTGCITKLNGGCKSNGACSVVDIEAGCTTNSSGGFCIWNSNNQCVDKICTNAPNTNTTHDLCSTFMSSCTVNTTNNGCRSRTCDNASTDYDTNNKCNTYLAGCITKTGGGCMTNTTCAAVGALEKACVKDSSGNDCIFDFTCKDKTCTNAPISNTTHSLCQTFMNTCTVNSTNNGCIDMNCENIQALDNCVKDKNNKICVWKEKCYKKHCQQAPLTLITYSDCTGFMTSCTVDNDGYGCMNKPLQCSNILTQAGCVDNSSGNACAWSNNKCQNKSCSTAPSTITTTTDCNTYFSGCIVNNTNNGCIDPTTTACSARTLEANCNVSTGPVCLRDPTQTTTCIAKSCLTASQTTITTANGFIAKPTPGFSNTSCDSYLSGCIVNNTQDGCVAKATSCSTYTTYLSCSQGLQNGSLCYWNILVSTCVDKQCSLIKYANHYLCQNAFDTCTYGNGTSCATKSAICSAYTNSNSCFKTSEGKSCTWSNGTCRDATCDEAPNVSQFDTHSECNDLNSNCTVIDRVANTGCVNLLANCSDYTSGAQCYLTSTGDKCAWNSTQCVLRSQLTCSQISLSTYTTANCQAVKPVCKENGDQTACVDSSSCSDLTSDCSDYSDSCLATGDGTACFNKPTICDGNDQNHCVSSDQGTCQWTTSCYPTVVCSNKTGANLKFSDCQAYSTACTVNLSSTSCFPILETCNLYLDQISCRQSSASKCKWSSNSCKPIDSPIVCANIVGIPQMPMTYTICQDFDLTCSFNQTTTACVTKEANCSSYTPANCGKATDGSCIYAQSACQVMTSALCPGIFIPNLTDDYCKLFHSSCRASDGGPCYEASSQCSDYKFQMQCVTTLSDNKCFWYHPLNGQAQCIQITTPSTDCAKIQLVKYSINNCSFYNSSCISNLIPSACIEKKALCSQTLNQDDCLLSSQGRCFWYQGICYAILSASDCSKIQGLINLTQDMCQQINTACTVSQDKTGCEAKSCSNKPSTDGFADTVCNTYLSTCTSNSIATPTSCVTVSATCNLYTTSDTCIRATEGFCQWVAGAVANTGYCVLKTCNTAPQTTSYNTHAQCNAYLNQCTVAKMGGCRSKGACNTYKSSLPCLGVGTCFWNARLNYGCVDKTCNLIEVAYNTHELCYATEIGCTVKANSQGCLALGDCNTYTIQNQCHVNASKKNCIWITTSSGSSCQLKSCLTAGTSNTTHQQCYTYFQNDSELDSEMCTVAIVEVNGTSTPQGCKQVQVCSNYNNEANCKIDNEGNDCAWNSTTNNCALKSCVTAPQTDSFDTDAECRDYLSDHTCTVDSSGTGCVIRPKQCDGMTQAQCVTTSDGTHCEWFNDNCVNKVCETAPSDITTAEECNNYLSGCTMTPPIKCKTQICEDFTLTTDSECETAKQGCTTNGTYCVLRTDCSAAYQSGCITQSDGKLCQWVSSTSTCAIRTCLTAPTTTDYSTESQCAAYFTGCTTKSGNGCISKTTCASANVQAACTTASDNTKCVWDSNRCRNIDCQDYSGLTYAECQKKGINCTAGLNGKCIQLSNCENVLTRQACIYGLNGSCLWIADYNNGEGACFAYTSCKSQLWNNDNQCKMISDQCTTNGTNCLAITSCVETNTSGGCKTGLDGNCIQSVSSLGSTEPAVCKVYNSCSEAYYNTHIECQNANIKCTTNGITGCAPLSSCSTYTISEACKINDKFGPTYDQTTGGIAVTGLCVWDTTTNANASCRDQICSDLIGLTHQACQVQLSICTSDGVNCLIKSICSSYKTQNACENGQGSDGPQGECFWEVASTTNNNTANCRIMKCSDIQNGITTEVCQASLNSCVSDGFVCIAQDKCATYKTQISCNSMGTDGICVFTASTATGAAVGSGTCSLMTQCSSANNDQNACVKAKDRCSWTAASGSGTQAIASKCVAHTCATFTSTNPTLGCQAFSSWDKLTQQVCTIVKGVCIETDPSTLTADGCYTISSYTYTWNQSTNKCAICTTTNTINNTNNTNNTNSTNSTNSTTNQGFMIGLASVIIGFSFC